MLIRGACRGQAFEITPVGESDLPALLDLYRQCEDFLALGPQPHASPELVRADLQLSADGGGVFCGIYVGQGALTLTLAGVVDYVPHSFAGDPHCASLSLLMIAPPHRGRGLGAEVVRLVEAEVLKDPRVREIDSGVQVNNPSAVRFWLRQGYRITGGPDLMPDRTTVYHLRKTFGMTSR